MGQETVSLLYYEQVSELSMTNFLVGACLLRQFRGIV